MVKEVFKIIWVVIIFIIFNVAIWRTDAFTYESTDLIIRLLLTGLTLRVMLEDINKS